MSETPARAEEVEYADSCPHVNLNDTRCASRFCLGRIEQAFSVCFGSYRGCPMYHRINAERNQRQHDRLNAAGLAVIAITARGAAVPLRPTGS